MKHVVIGTAGHIDHGKTALVKRLTGVDTDRLEEEKRRGMTIELGFASLKLPNGIDVSIVDVPGHEKFVKTMVAGVTGIDIVILVVAADEGVMPQTSEHIDILSLLNISRGVVAITKTDLIEKQWLELVIEDVTNVLKGTSMEKFPIIPVSSVTGEGMDTLVEDIEKLTIETGIVSSPELFRLSVDRSFTMQGYGTVVTGTISGGSVIRGDMVEILPRGIMTRIRGIQVHNRFVESASSGDRCALNLANVEKTDVERGDTIFCPGVIQISTVVDAVLHVVRGEGEVKHNQRVHVHTGTKEILARIRIIGADNIPEGGSGYVQLRFEEPAAVLRGDRFIIRSYSPVRTIGGGKIIFHNVPNRSRFDNKNLKIMELEESGKADEIIIHVLKSSGNLLSLDDLWKVTLINKTEIIKILEDKISNGDVVALEESEKYLSIDTFEAYTDEINKQFESLYAKYPYRFQIEKEEIKSRLFTDVESKDFNELINKFINRGKLIQKNKYIMLPGDNAVNKIKSKPEVLYIEKAFLGDGINPRKLQQVIQDIGISIADGGEAARFLIQIGKLIELEKDVVIHITALKNAVEQVKDLLEQQGSVAVGDIRDCIGTSRKLAIALMEFLDRKEVTSRSGDKRISGPNMKKASEILQFETGADYKDVPG